MIKRQKINVVINKKIFKGVFIMAKKNNMDTKKQAGMNDCAMKQEGSKAGNMKKDEMSNCGCKKGMK